MASSAILQRPQFMAVSFFSDYSQEAVSSVGVENEALLERINSALNSPKVDEAILAMSEDEARKAAHAEGIAESKYFAFLSFLHEIEFRKTNPSARWGRHPSVVPCPDWMPPNSRQIPARKMPYLRVFSKIFNIAMIVVIFGAFPFFVAPLSHSVVAGSSLSVRAAISISVWLFAVIAAAFSRLAMRFFRRKSLIC